MKNYGGSAEEEEEGRAESAACGGRQWEGFRRHYELVVELPALLWEGIMTNIFC